VNKRWWRWWAQALVVAVLGGCVAQAPVGETDKAAKADRTGTAESAKGTSPKGDETKADATKDGEAGTTTASGEAKADAKVARKGKDNIARGKAIIVGAVFPLSAGAGRIGQMKRQGADLAVGHLNASGGIRGRPLQINYVDSKNQINEAKTGFDKLLDKDKVPLVFSAMSQVSLTLAGAAERRKVVLYANASHPELTRGATFVFRNLPSTEKTATAMADAALNKLSLRKVAVLAINDEYGADAAKTFTTAFGKLGGKVVASETFDREAKDVRAQWTKLAEARPDAYWVPGYGAALGLVLKQKVELKVPGTVLCDLGLVDANVLKTAGAGAETAAVVVPAFDPESKEPVVRTFVRDFSQAYGEAPSFDAAFQYDATMLVAEACRRAKQLTGEGLREALAAIKGFQGVCGKLTFTKTGDADAEVMVRRMVRGKLRPLDAPTEEQPKAK